MITAILTIFAIIILMALGFTAIPLLIGLGILIIAALLIRTLIRIIRPRKEIQIIYVREDKTNTGA